MADTTLFFASATGHQASQQMAVVVRDLLAANRGAKIRVEPLDPDTQGARMRKLGLSSYPALILEMHGQERVRLVGPRSKRSVLHAVLPELYDENEALVELRRQLDSPGEVFPRRALKRRERVNRTVRVAMLGGVPLFETLNRRQLESVAKMADELVVETDTVLTEEGRPGDQFFVLVDGTARVEQKRRKVATIASGDCFGEMSLLDGGPRSATVRASERCVLLAVDRMAFQTLLLESPTLSIALLQVLSQRLRDA